MNTDTYQFLAYAPFVGLLALAGILALFVFCTWLGDWLNPHEPPDMSVRRPWLWGWE